MGLRELDTDHGRLTAVDLGATVLTWRPAGARDVLFLSRDAQMAEGDEIHGGIPICAPWFGQGRDGVTVPAPHGLVRWAPWRLASASEDSLVWELDAADVAHLPGASEYPPDLRFNYRAWLSDELTVTFTVESPTTEFVLDEALHCYFAVADAREVRITGLEGEPFRDYSRGAEWFDGEAEPVVGAEANRVYHRAGEMTIHDADRAISLRPSGAASTILWNPGPDAGLRGLAADEWTRFVCVEVGNVQARAVTVAAGGSHTLGLTIRVAA